MYAVHMFGECVDCRFCTHKNICTAHALAGIALQVHIYLLMKIMCEQVPII